MTEERDLFNPLTASELGDPYLAKNTFEKKRVWLSEGSPTKKILEEMGFDFKRMSFVGTSRKRFQEALVDYFFIGVKTRQEKPRIAIHAGSHSSRGEMNKLLKEDRTAVRIGIDLVKKLIPEWQEGQKLGISDVWTSTQKEAEIIVRAVLNRAKKEKASVIFYEGPISPYTVNHFGKDGGYAVDIHFCAVPPEDEIILSNRLISSPAKQYPMTLNSSGDPVKAVVIGCQSAMKGFAQIADMAEDFKGQGVEINFHVYEYSLAQAHAGLPPKEAPYQRALPSIRKWAELDIERFTETVKKVHPWAVEAKRNLREKIKETIGRLEKDHQKIVARRKREFKESSAGLGEISGSKKPQKRL